MDLYRWLLTKNMLPQNPCRIRGAGDEHAEERPELTVPQVFDLAERVGRRPVGNIRKAPDGYRLRFRRHGEMRTSPERYSTRQGHDDAIDTHVQGEQGKAGDEDGAADALGSAG